MIYMMRANAHIVSSHMETRRTKPIGSPKRPTQARSKLTVAAIVEASAHILSTSGYDALTTNKVAERAGVSIGSLYQYFPSKEALVAEVLDQYCDRIETLIAQVFLQSPSAAPAQLARAVVHAFYASQAKDPALARVLREQLPKLGRLQRLEQVMARISGMVASYLHAHRGILRVKNIERAAFLAVEMGESLVMASILKRPSDSADDVIDEITDVALRYLLRDAPRRPAQR